MEEARYWDLLHASAASADESQDWYASSTATMGALAALPCAAAALAALATGGTATAATVTASTAAAALLHLGCGTSDLGELLAATVASATGVVVNVDFSAVAIESQRRRAARCGAASARQRYEVADAAALPFADAAFLAVVDKGTMDAVLQPATAVAMATAAAVLREALRVVAPGSWVLLLSIVAPAVRLPVLQRLTDEWRASISEARVGADCPAAGGAGDVGVVGSEACAAGGGEVRDGAAAATDAAVVAEAPMTSSCEACETDCEGTDTQWRWHVHELPLRPLELPYQRCIWLYALKRR